MLHSGRRHRYSGQSHSGCWQRETGAAAHKDCSAGPMHTVIARLYIGWCSQVEAYLTTADQLHAEGVTATLLGSKSDGLTGDGLDNISISTTGSPVLKMNESYYVWLTADIVNAAGAESEIVDAAIVSISYVNGKEATKTVDVSAKGDPDGNMRIFKHQSFIRVSTENNGTEAHYYRNPAILNIADNTVLAFYEDRYDNPNGLGKDYDGSNYGHRIDVKVRKSTDNGVNWSDPVAIGTGTDATETTQPSGFAGPAVVKSGSTIICLMAQGTNSYDAGLTSVYKSTSSDGGQLDDANCHQHQLEWCLCHLILRHAG